MAKISLKTLAPRLSATPNKAINIAEPVQPSHLLPYGEKWKKARDKFLAEHKYCVYCERRGIKTTATVCDHIVPHKGDKSLFWNKDNWQALCNHCHNTIKAEEERRLGYR